MDGIPKPYPRSIIESMRFMMCFPSVPWMRSIRRMILVNLLFTEIMRFLRRFKFYHMKTCKHIFQNTKRKPQMKFNHINIIYILYVYTFIFIYHISYIQNIYIFDQIYRYVSLSSLTSLAFLPPGKISHHFLRANQRYRQVINKVSETEKEEVKDDKEDPNKRKKNTEQWKRVPGCLLESLGDEMLPIYLYDTYIYIYI